MSVAKEIEERINIVDLVARYVPLKKSGTNYKASCPFHKENTPSFLVSPNKNIAYCFGCHHGGGPLKFLMDIERISYQEALQKLAKEAGVELKVNFSKERQNELDNLYDIYARCATLYHEALFLPEYKDKLEYLLNRGLNIETIKKFSIGYSAPNNKMYDKLVHAGFNQKELNESGIFLSPHKDKFHNRIIFPITSISGSVIAFTGRVTNNEDQPKYLNSPASRIFDKSNVLFGFSHAKVSIGKKNYVIIVEGQMDTISLHQYGYDNTVAISGSTLTQEQIETLSRFSRVFYLSFDQDTAGLQATFSALENTKNTETEIRILSFGDSAKDPDEFLKKGGNFEEVLAQYKTPIGFYLEVGEKQFALDTLPGKKAFLQEIFGFLKNIRSSIEIDGHLKEISRKLDISLDVLYNEFRNTKVKPIAKENNPVDEKKQPNDLELIAAHLSNYGFFDLFFEKFRYNIADISHEIGGHLLNEVLTKKQDISKSESIDYDYLKSLELLIETENESLGNAGVEKKFISLVSRLNLFLWEKEKELLGNCSSDEKNTEAWLEKYLQLTVKKKNLR